MGGLRQLSQRTIKMLISACRSGGAEATCPMGSKDVDPGLVTEETISNILTYKTTRVVGFKVARSESVTGCNIGQLAPTA